MIRTGRRAIRVIGRSGSTARASVTASAASTLQSAPLEGRVRDLVEQQSALRELAIAVAEMRAPEVIYELVAKQAADVSGVDAGAGVRFRVDRVGEVVGSWRMGSRHTGSLIPLDSTSAVAVVARTGRAARTGAGGRRGGRLRDGGHYGARSRASWLVQAGHDAPAEVSGRCAAIAVRRS